jgi:hypothetical protein
MIDPDKAGLTVREALEQGMPPEAIEALSDLHARLADECRKQFEDGTAELVLALDPSTIDPGDERRAGVDALVSWGWGRERAESVVGEVEIRPDGLRVVVVPLSDDDWVDTYCMVDFGKIGAPLLHDAASWTRRRATIHLVKG